MTWIRTKPFERFADLHLHTTASDGTLSPHQVVERAKMKGFSTIAITDNDTTAGLEDAKNAGILLGLEVIPGIELSTLDGEKEIHILGYFIDRSSDVLQEMLFRIESARRTRAAKMVQKLNDLGIDITLARVSEISGGSIIGRPHIAKALLEKGCIKNQAEAFTKDFMASGGRAYVERSK